MAMTTAGYELRTISQGFNIDDSIDPNIFDQFKNGGDVDEDENNDFFNAWGTEETPSITEIMSKFQCIPMSIHLLQSHLLQSHL